MRSQVSRDIAINIAIGVFFILAGCIGLFVGNMNILSIVMIVIGAAVMIVQIKKVLDR